LRLDVNVGGVALNLEATPKIRHVVGQNADFQSIKKVVGACRARRPQGENRCEAA
jgi:hypothetical protein